MVEQERKKLAEAAIPLEVLCGQIRSKPYKELDARLQAELLKSLNSIRELIFDATEIT